MSKQIAVIMLGVTFDNQKKMLEGMIDAVKEKDSNLYVFSHYISLRDKEEVIKGANQIITLPDLSTFDGIIIARSTIQYQPAAEYALKAIQESGVPAVSIDVDIPGTSWVGISSYEAEIEMIDHFVLEHGCKDIYYVTGALTQPEAQKRYQAYCDALDKHGIPYEEEKVYKGFFDMDSGRRAVKKFLENGRCPEVIVCANDAMATGVMEELRRCEYYVPKDVRVAGFDNGELTQLYSPSITTVNKNQYGVGRRAVYAILDRIAGGEIKRHSISCSLEVRESCGCVQENKMDVGRLKEIYVRDNIFTQNMSEMLCKMSMDFAGMEDPDELIEALKKYIVTSELKSFYLCLCERDSLFGRQEYSLDEEVDIEQKNIDYTERMTLPLAYEEGEFRTYDDFYKGLVLPEECRNRSGGNFYIITPLHYQSVCYGYCVSGNSRLPIDSTLYYSCMMNIASGLENIRKWMMIKSTVIRLNSVWAYDMMTHLYNRAGFFYQAKPMLFEMQERDEEVFLLFMDIDGLKGVNDTMGHENGDWFIKEVAEVIKHKIENGMVAMRYGGDEFVVFGNVDKNSENLAEELQKAMDERNTKMNYPFKLKASIGMSRYKASEITNLDALIEQADMKMYEEKRQRKQKGKVYCLI